MTHYHDLIRPILQIGEETLFDYRPSDFKLAKAAFREVKRLYIELKQAIKANGFPDETIEIAFFKQCFPEAYSWFLFFNGVIHLWKAKPPENEKIYLLRLNEKLQEQIKAQHELFWYMELENTHLDSHYFTTKAYLPELEAEESQLNEDRCICTNKGAHFARYLCNQKLMGYIAQRINQIARETRNQEEGMENLLEWNTSVIDLVELVDALFLTQKVQAKDSKTIKAVANAFGLFFGTELSNFSHYKGDLRRRKDPAKFLRNLLSEYEKALKEEAEKNR